MQTAFTVIRSQRRTLSLHITHENAVVVKAPLRISDQDIKQFVHEHSEWIATHLAKRMKHKKSDNEYMYLGKSLVFSSGGYTDISVKEDKLLFPQALLFRKEKELTNWYTRQARALITKQVNSFAQEMGVTYTELTFSDTSSQWGRCTHDNRLQFNWRLVMAPILVINYVVIHELSHTLEKNHTRAFWAIVRKYNPSYRQQIKWLKEHGASIQTAFSR